jgi:hypothetical protein
MARTMPIPMSETGGSQQQRQAHQGGAGVPFSHARSKVGEVGHTQGRGNGDGGDHGAAVGLEDVRPHAGDVAHVVAHVVGDHARVARVVLRDAGFHLTHQIGTHVRTLGIDAAADPGEEGDHGGAHAEPVNVVSGFRIAAEDVVQGAEPQQAHGRHREAHDGAAEEGHGECGSGTVLMCCRGGAHVGLGGGVHADPAGNGRGQGTDEEGDGRGPAQRQPQHDDQHHGDDGQVAVLGAHEDHGTAVNGVGDLLDLVIAFVVALHQTENDEGHNQAHDTEYRRYQGCVYHWYPQLSTTKKSQKARLEPRRQRWRRSSVLSIGPAR